MTSRAPRASTGRERGGRRGWLLRRVVLAAGLTGSQASADTPELSWSAPRECPSAAFVQTEVARVVGRPWSELSAQWRSMRAAVSLDDRGYRARVTVVTREGLERSRSVLAASCTEATEAAVAILTAGMDPAGANAASPASEAASAPAAALEGIASEKGPHGLDAQPAREPGADPATPALPLLAAQLGLDIGSLAAVAPFAQISGGVEWGRFSALASASATGRVVGELAGGSAGAQMSLLLGGATACWRVTATNPSLAGCGGLELGSLAARGIGTVGSRAGQVFWSASVARAALDWNIGAGGVVSLGASGVFPFRHLRVISSPEQVHRTPSVALRPWLGVGLRFE